MDFINFIGNVLGMAFSQSLDITQTILFVAFMVAGIAGPRIPAIHMKVDWSGWKFAALVFGSIVAVRLLLAPYWLWQDENDGRLKAVRERDSLKIELATKKDRSVLRAQLVQFYADGAMFASGGTITKESTADDLNKYEAETYAWRDKVAMWISQNMTPGAAGRFLNVYGELRKQKYINFMQRVNERHNWIMNEVQFHRENIETLINTDVWDKP